MVLVVVGGHLRELQLVPSFPAFHLHLKLSDAAVKGALNGMGHSANPKYQGEAKHLHR